jgi:hypothetical protein
MSYNDDVRALIKSAIGRDDIEVVGEGPPCICGRVSLVPWGQMGCYLLFQDQTGKIFATPVPFGFSQMEGPDYCSVKEGVS